MSTRLLLPLTTLVCLVIITVERTAILPPLAPIAALLAATLYRWALLLAVFALLAGVLNVAWVHGRRVQRGAHEWPLSLALLAVLLAVLIGGTISEPLTRIFADPNAVAATTSNLASANVLLEWVFDSILAPSQRALFALLAFFVAAAAYELLRVGRPSGRWMLLGALAVLLVQLPAAATVARTPLAAIPSATAANDAISAADVAFWLLDAPVTAAVRGVLLGGGLALLVAGVRALRPATASPVSSPTSPTDSQP